MRHRFIVTIMVLDLKVPQDASASALATVTPVFVSYVLSFLYVAIYWNNHHHFFHLVQHVDGTVLWSHLNLLFWLSLVPFTTGWMGENHFAPLPTAVYGISLLMPALAWLVMQWAIIRGHGRDATFAQAIGHDLKGKISPMLYAVGIALSFVAPWAGGAMYLLGALLWLVPDRRVERMVPR